MKRTLLFLLDKMGEMPDFDDLKSEWDFVIAPNSQFALDSLGNRDYEAVVADYKYQTNEDTPFLSRVANRAPMATRLILCQSSAQDPVQTDATAHQYLDKPCSAQDIVNGVERARLVETWLKDPKVKDLYSQMKNLPSLPSIYFRLVKLLQSPDTELDDVGAIIAEDLVMTARVLQVVNSAVFGLGRQIANPVEAVSYLGIERTKALALVSHTFSKLTPPTNCSFSIEKLWEHSMATASLAQMITREETGDIKMAESAFTGGMLHDVGKLMLAANLPEDYQAVTNHAESRQIPFHEAEDIVLGANHAQIGACVMGIWGLPPEIVESIGFHHSPSDYFVEGFTAATGIHMADVLERESRGEKDPIPHPLDLEHIEKVRMSSRLLVWREIVGSTVTEAAA